MKKESVIVILFFVVLFVCVGFFIFISRNDTTSLSSVLPDTPVNISFVPKGVFPRVVPVGWKEYQQATYHVSLLYPDTLTVTEKKQPGTAIVVTFENKLDTQQAFQLYIVPYGEKLITPQRLKRDVPSGVMKDFKDRAIDGVDGVMFLSQDTKLGATREAWFIHHGFLYEFTTYQALDAWLQNILETWRFFPEEPKPR